MLRKTVEGTVHAPEIDGNEQCGNVCEKRTLSETVNNAN